MPVQRADDFEPNVGRRQMKIDLVLQAQGVDQTTKLSLRKAFDQETLDSGSPFGGVIVRASHGWRSGLVKSIRGAPTRKRAR